MANNALTMPLVYSLPRMAAQKATDQQQRTPQGLPCTVTKVMGELVQVKVEAQGNYTIPTILVPKTHSQWAREPTQVGDKGILLSADYYVGGMSGIGDGTANYKGRGNLTPMVFQPVSQKKFSANTDRNLNAYFLNAPEGVVAQTTSGNSVVTVGSHSLVLKFGGTTVTLSADSVVIVAGGSTTTFDSSGVTTTGNVQAGDGGGDSVELQHHVHAGGPPPDAGS